MNEDTIRGFWWSYNSTRGKWEQLTMRHDAIARMEEVDRLVAALRQVPDAVREQYIQFAAEQEVESIAPSGRP